VSIEVPFFMDLAAGLPPVIGVPDLVLRRHDWLVLVDHKTSRSFNDCDPAQLVLYGEHLRREHAHDRIVGVFDEYRLVRDLSTVRKPAFRRTPVSVDHSLLPALIQRYRKAWLRITEILSEVSLQHRRIAGMRQMEPLVTVLPGTLALHGQAVSWCSHWNVAPAARSGASARRCPWLRPRRRVVSAGRRR